jgi:hypothetical protein
VGTFAGAEAQAQQAAYQAQIARNNAINEQQKQVEAINAGRQNAQASSLQNAARLAGIKGSIAASGIDPNSGSAELVQQSQREVGLLNTQNVYHNADVEAWGYKVASLNDTAQANLYQSEADQAPIAGALGAAGSILGGAKAFAGGAGGSVAGGGGTGGGSVLSPEDNWLENG